MQLVSNYSKNDLYGTKKNEKEKRKANRAYQPNSTK